MSKKINLRLDRRDPMPSYSVMGSANRDIFLGDRNLVLFYFEDEGYEEFYLRLVNQIFPNIQLRDVFCLGGKGNVNARLRESVPAGKARVFVLDKDFGDLVGFVVEHREVVYLHRYSIENYFLDLPAILQVVVEHKRGMRIAAIEDVLKVDEYFDDLLESYEPLARLFAVTQLNELPLQSTKLKFGAFMDDKSCLVNEGYLEKFKLKVMEQASKKGLEIKSPPKLDVALAAAFTPQVQFVGHADTVRHAHFCGKHLLNMITIENYSKRSVDTHLTRAKMRCGCQAASLMLGLPFKASATRQGSNSSTL